MITEFISEPTPAESALEESVLSGSNSSGSNSSESTLSGLGIPASIAESDPVSNPSSYSSLFNSHLFNSHLFINSSLFSLDLFNLNLFQRYFATLVLSKRSLVGLRQLGLMGVTLLLLGLQFPAFADYKPPRQDPPRSGTGSSGMVLTDGSLHSPL